MKRVIADESTGRARSIWVWVALLVLAALAVRWLFYIGYQGHDDRSYIAFAWMVAHGGDFASRQIADPWTGRLLAWLPSSIYIRLFGVDEWVLTLHSLMFSLLAVGAAFVVVGHFHGHRAGLIAGGLMVLLPIEVLYGTRAFGDQATGTLCALTLALFLLMLQKRSRAWALATGLCGGLAYLSKETAVLMALPLVSILLVRKELPMALLTWLLGGFLAVFATELFFWQLQTGDALYRWHATLGSRDGFVPPPKPIHGWLDYIPSPIPAEIMRSSNTLLDALLMITTNEEWGLLFYLAIPLAIAAVWRGDEVLRAVALFMLAMLMLLLFLPLHFPHYTLGRDPRHFTALGLPAVWLVAVWVARIGAGRRALVLGSLAASWLVCLAVGYVSSDIGTARALARWALDHPGQRVWSNNIITSDIVVLSGFDERAKVGVVRFKGGHVVDASGPSLSNPVRAMRPSTPVASRVADLAGQMVALPSGVAPEPGWTLQANFSSPPGPMARAIRGTLQRLSVPTRFVDKLAPSQGESIRLYQVPSSDNL